jgi:hypothetical protein
VLPEPDHSSLRSWPDAYVRQLCRGRRGASPGDESIDAIAHLNR